MSFLLKAPAAQTPFYALDATIQTLCAGETVMLAIPLGVGFFANNKWLRFTAGVSAGAIDTINFNFYIGASATNPALNGNIGSVLCIPGSSQSQSLTIGFRRDDVSQLAFVGLINNLSAFGTYTQGVGGANVDTAALYLMITGNGSVEDLATVFAAAVEQL